jgi:hypothetical protein
MGYDDSADGLTPEAVRSLSLPPAFDEADLGTAMDIDRVLSEGETPSSTLHAKVNAHREVAQSHLHTHMRKVAIDVNLFAWPPFLYIPKGANFRDYWISPAPADHRYGLEWTSPGASANHASVQDGTVYSFSQLINSAAGTSVQSESGIGVFYDPPMSLGVIDLQPDVNCSGDLRTMLEYSPAVLSAGYVEVKAHLLLAAWQVIPGGFDLLGWKQFDVATSGRRDPTFGPELLRFESSFSGTSLSAPFVVQRGRRYLLGVVGRVSVTSTLTSNHGGPLKSTDGGPLPNTVLRVWGDMTCVVPQIDVLTKRVDIP